MNPCDSFCDGSSRAEHDHAPFRAVTGPIAVLTPAVFATGQCLERGGLDSIEAPKVLTRRLAPIAFIPAIYPLRMSANNCVEPFDSEWVNRLRCYLESSGPSTEIALCIADGEWLIPADRSPESPKACRSRSMVRGPHFPRHWRPRSRIDIEQLSSAFARGQGRGDLRYAVQKCGESVGPPTAGFSNSDETFRTSIP